MCICRCQVEDQMKLLQNCWSELLILDLIFRQINHNNFEELYMVSERALI